MIIMMSDDDGSPESISQQSVVVYHIPIFPYFHNIIRTSSDSETDKQHRKSCSRVL